LITGETKGPFDFTLMVKGRDKIQRIVETTTGALIRYGSDGKNSWQTSGPILGDAAGRVVYLIDSQTRRSVCSLFTNAAKGYALRDLGPAKKDASLKSASSRIIEAQDDKGQATRYYIDDTTSLITQLEYDTGQFYALPFDDQKYPLMAALVFSDYRRVDGIMAPFKIELYEGLIKIEEMNFTSIKLNNSLADDVFVP
jgi:hypothetical protein